MIRKLLPLCLLLISPGVADAHPGHPHVVNEQVHHSLEVVSVLVVAAVLLFAWRRYWTSRRDARL